VVIINEFATLISSVIAVLIICIQFCLPANAEKAKKVPQLHCWRIEQTNLLWGDLTIYASAEALKVVTKNGKWMDIARAPAWKPYVLSPTSKTFCFVPLEKWDQSPLKINTLNLAAVEWVHTKEEQKIGGLQAIKIVPKASVGRRNKIAGGDYWISRDLQLPDPVCHMLCGNAALPQLHAVPLRVSIGNNSIGSTHTAYSVNTISASQVDLPATFFDLPKDFKETKQVQEVMSAGVMDVVKDMTGF
jgi:hypothetical protein